MSKRERGHESDVHVPDESVTREARCKKTETEPRNTFIDSYLSPKYLKQHNILIYSGPSSLLKPLSHTEKFV